ncbi:hypothetical protein OKW38_003141 [Paraburkholderia sp. MM5496-R1]
MKSRTSLYLTIDALEAKLQLALIATVLNPKELCVVEAGEILEIPHVCVI